MFAKYSLWRIFIVFLSSINFTLAVGNYRENHALRHPCNAINKRLEPYITWTERLANSQYRGKLFQSFLTRYFLHINILIDKKNPRCIISISIFT